MNVVNIPTIKRNDGWVERRRRFQHLVGNKKSGEPQACEGLGQK